MKTKSLFFMLLAAIGMMFSLSSCEYDPFHDDFENGVIAEFIDIDTKGRFTKEVWRYSEYDDNYLICGLDNRDNNFLVINVRDDGYNDSKPSVWEEYLLPLNEVGEEIDLLNSSTGLRFSYDVDPCVYEGCLYWRSSSNKSNVYALISKYKTPVVIRDYFWKNRNVKCNFKSNNTIQVWNWSSRDYFIRLR